MYRLPPGLVVRKTVICQTFFTHSVQAESKFGSCNLKFNLESELQCYLKSDLKFKTKFDLVTINSALIQILSAMSRMPRVRVGGGGDYTRHFYFFSLKMFSIVRRVIQAFLF